MTKVTDVEFVVTRSEPLHHVSGATKYVENKRLVHIGATTIGIPHEDYLYLGRDVSWLTLFVSGHDIILFPCSPMETGARKVEYRNQRSRVYIKLKPYEQHQFVRGDFKAKRGLDKPSKQRCLRVYGVLIYTGTTMPAVIR